jgi:hypothetical protein
MAIDIDDARRLTRAAVIGRAGKKLGTVAAVYYDNHTDQPEWGAVRTGVGPAGRRVGEVHGAAR